MGMLDYIVHRKPETRERGRKAVLAGYVPEWVANCPRNRYILQVIVSCPPWADRDELKAIQARTRELTESTGVPHHVSHIVPLNHPRMCGLTVPWNLEPKPAKANMAESNHVIPEEQLALW